MTLPRTTEQLVEEHQAGHTVKQLASRYGVTPEAIYNRFKRVGYHRRRHGRANQKPGTKIDGMTETQRRLLAALREDDRRSLRELMALCGISSTSVVNYNLVRLEALGYLERGPCGQARAWRVCNRPDPALAVVEAARPWAAHDERLAAVIREWEAGRV